MKVAWRTAWMTALLAQISICLPQVSACPLRDGLVDFNCDRKIKIGFAGDSVVQGVGDGEFNNFGGYPKRLDRLMPQIEVENLGVSGYTSAQVRNKLNSVEAKRKLRNADMIFIDVGRNDCRDSISASRTIRTLKATLRDVKGQFKPNDTELPFLVLATQIPDRERRRPCIEALNRALVSRRSKKFPVYLRFDKLPPDILSSDGIHPDSDGYERMARYLKRFLVKKGAARALMQRADNDGDGVFDIFELSKFGTSPANADTDGDGSNDGLEIFELETDPLTPQ